MVLKIGAKAAMHGGGAEVAGLNEAGSTGALGTKESSCGCRDPHKICK